MKPRERRLTTIPYGSIKIPPELAAEIDRLVGTHGFTSRAEFVKQAARELLLKYPSKGA